MKPAYEIVRADDVDDGDIVIIGPDHVFRQLPPDRNPEVLMRALQMTCTRLRDIDWESNKADPDSFIRLSIRELESEAGK